MKEYLSTSEGRKQMRANIDEILSWMDFKKIADVLGFLHQGWSTNGMDVDSLVENGYEVFDDEYGCGKLYIPKEKDVLLKAKKYWEDLVEDALDLDEVPLQLVERAGEVLIEIGLVLVGIV